MKHPSTPISFPQLVSQEFPAQLHSAQARVMQWHIEVSSVTMATWRSDGTGMESNMAGQKNPHKKLPAVQIVPFQKSYRQNRVPRLPTVLNYTIYTLPVDYIYEAILYYTILYYIYYTILYYTILYYTIYSILYYTIQYYTVLY